MGKERKIALKKLDAYTLTDVPLRQHLGLSLFCEQVYEEGIAPAMNLHQLQIFYAVAQRQSITDAASDLHLTQPAVSLQVKALEKDLGLPLLERGGPKLRLTQAGEALYRCAISILHAKDEAERAIAELRQATKGKLILGANTTGGMYVL